MPSPPPSGRLVQAHAVVIAHHAVAHGPFGDLHFRGELGAVLRAVAEVPGEYRLRSMRREAHLVRARIERHAVEEDGWIPCGHLVITLGFPRPATEIDHWENTAPVVIRRAR